MTSKIYRNSIFWALLVSIAGAIYSYLLHSPTIGIDDANITQTYANNIARGYGYVYNEGGEKVEGSTSIAWTIVNIIFFYIFENPENLIAVFCFLLTVATISEAFNLLKVLTINLEVNLFFSGIIFILFLISFPSFFSWSIWTLMDTSLWILLFTIIVSRTCTLVTNKNQSTVPNNSLLLLYFSLVMLPFVRPEGIAISLGFLSLLLIYSIKTSDLNLRKVVGVTVVTTIMLLSIVTLLRLNYFGYPVPNTFYAKVSTNYIDQATTGLNYFIKYLKTPIIATLVTLSFSLIPLMNLISKKLFQVNMWLNLVLVSSIIGVFCLYIVLGGDHFGSARHFQILTPLISVISSICLGQVVKFLSEKFNKKDISINFAGPIIIFVTVVLVIPSLYSYSEDKGNIDHEFRISEEGQLLGALLNELPNSPSIGVIAAGGISRTYKGHIYDLMGLNWIEMAHSNRLHNSEAPKNHAAFNKSVFYKYKPDIVVPLIDVCEYISEKEIGTSFKNKALDGLLLDEEFKASYTFVCFKEASFYINKSLTEEIGALLTEPINYNVDE